MVGAATIRQLTAADLECTVRFFQSIDHENYKKHFSPHPFTELEAERVCHYQGRDQYLGVFVGPGDDMVGYGMLRGLDEGYEIPSLGLCILDSRQGEGLGRLLLEKLLGACAKRGAEKAMIKVKKDNRVAKALYEKAGFVFDDLNQEFLVGYRTLP